MALLTQDYKNYLEQIGVPKDGFDAIDKGAAPRDVANRWIESQAADAISKGADKNAINQRLVDLSKPLDVLDAKAPKTKMEQFGDRALSGMLGAGKGVLNFLEGVKDIGEAGMPENMPIARNLPDTGINTQGYEQLPLVQEQPKSALTGEIVGEIAPTMATLGKVTPGALMAPSATLKGALAKNVATGAYQGALMGGGDIKDSLSAAQTGAMFGGALGAVPIAKTGLAKVVNKLVKGKGSEKGLTLAQQTGSEVASNAEDLVAKVPGLNKNYTKSVKALSDDVDNFIKNVDPDVAYSQGATEKLLGRVDEVVGNTTLNTTNLKKEMTRLATQIKNTQGSGSTEKTVSDEIMRRVANIDDNISFNDLWNIRKTWDDDIFKATGEIAANKFAKKAGIDLRNLITTRLEQVAQKGGAIREFKAGNYIYSQKKAYDKIKSVAANTLENTSNQRPDINAFMKQINKLIDEDHFLKNSKSIKEAAKGLSNLVKHSQNQVKTIKQGTKKLSLGQLAGLGLGTGASFYLANEMGMPLETVALAGAAYMLGSSYLLTNPKGIKLLQKMSKLSPDSPAMRKQALPLINAMMEQKDGQ